MDECIQRNKYKGGNFLALLLAESRREKNDFRLDSSKESLDGFKKAISDPHQYIGL